MTAINAVQRPQYTYQTQPNYNAVKIDINNPEVKTEKTVELKELKDSTYSYPKLSVYEVPTQSIYAPALMQTPIAVQAKAVEEPIKTAAIVPPPVVIQPQKTIGKAEPAEVAPKKIDIVEPEVLETDIDVNDIISKMSDPNYEIQAKAIVAVAEVVKSAPEKATELLDVKVIDTLLGIMNKDTSKLEAPSQAQLEVREKMIKGEAIGENDKTLANQLSPMEMAERNKQYSIYTVAMLGKFYASEIEKSTKNVVQITELPGAAGIVEQLKNNPNPMIRATSIDALSDLQRPEYKKDLTTLFTVAQKDQSPLVQEIATMALEKLNKSEAQPTQTMK